MSNPTYRTLSQGPIAITYGLNSTWGYFLKVADIRLDPSNWAFKANLGKFGRLERLGNFITLGGPGVYLIVRTSYSGPGHQISVEEMKGLWRLYELPEREVEEVFGGDGEEDVVEREGEIIFDRKGEETILGSERNKETFEGEGQMEMSRRREGKEMFEKGEEGDQKAVGEAGEMATESIEKVERWFEDNKTRH